MKQETHLSSENWGLGLTGSSRGCEPVMGLREACRSCLPEPGARMIGGTRAPVDCPLGISWGWGCTVVAVSFPPDAWRDKGAGRGAGSGSSVWPRRDKAGKKVRDE